MHESHEPPDPSRAFALLRAYLRRQAPLEHVVAALRALPTQEGETWFGLGERDLDVPGARERLDELQAALAEAARREGEGEQP